jgi:hypothetical protein
MKKILKADLNKIDRELYIKTNEKKIIGTIKAGETVDISFISTDNPHIMEVKSNSGLTVKINSKRWGKYFGKIPSMKTLENWVIGEGICKSVFGSSVEPDGWSYDGSPSWLLVLEMI